MKIQAEPHIRERARLSHDLYILNMFLFNLSAVGGVLGYSILRQPIILTAVLFALACSLLITGYIWYQARRLQGSSEHWLIMVHWCLTVRRSRLLLIGYLISAAIIGMGVLVGSGMQGNMQGIVTTVFTRVGILPALVMVLVTLILEGQAMHLANSAIAPPVMVRKYPVPADVVVIDRDDNLGE